MNSSLNSLLKKLLFLLLGVFALDANAQLLLNEIVVNPPGADDPKEFIELKGTPGSTLNKIYVCVFEGDSASAGNCDLVIPLNAITIGANGLVFVGSTLGFSAIPSQTTVIDTLSFAIPGGILENGNTTFAVIFSPIPMVYNADYDTNNDGTLDLPSGAVLQDAVGWTNGDLTAKIYGGVVLTQSAGTPDAAVRFYGNSTAFSKPAWYNGDLISNTTFDALETSSNFPAGGTSTPGDHNTPNTVGIEEMKSDLVGVFPNPGNGQFTVQGLQSDVAFSMSDLSGKCCYRGTTMNRSLELPQTISSGMYILSLNVDGIQVTKRLSVIR